MPCLSQLHHAIIGAWVNQNLQELDKFVLCSTLSSFTCRILQLIAVGELSFVVFRGMI